MKEDPLVPLAKPIPLTDAKPVQNPKPVTSPPKPQKTFSKPTQPQLPPRNEQLNQNESSSISKHTFDFSSIENNTKNPNTATNTNTKNHKSKTGLHVHEDEATTEDKLRVKRKRSNLKSKQKMESQERENSLPVSAPLPPAPPPTHLTNTSSLGDPDHTDPEDDINFPSSSINDSDHDPTSFSSSKRESGESNKNNNYSSLRDWDRDQKKKSLEITEDNKDQERKKTNELNLVSILNTTFKDQAKKVVIKEEDDCKADETAEEEETEQTANLTTDDEFFGEDDFDFDMDLDREWDGEGWTYSFPQQNQRRTMKMKAKKKSSAVQVPSNREQLAHEEEIYNGIQIKTFGDLLEAKARRPRRLDAYCLGRGLMEPRLDIVEPQVVPKSSLKEFQLEGYQQFMDKIKQIEEENTQNEQIICVFTADLVRRNKKTWSEDCNLIEAAVVFLCRYLEPTGYLLWVRAGSQKGWKDPESPFITDRHIVLKSLPTIKIWNSEKRLAGTRVFTLDNITVMLED